MPSYHIENDYGDQMRFGPAAYVGHTYPKVLDNRVARWLWSRTFCRRGWRLWDEMTSSESDHLLVCDACDAEFGIRAVVA